MIRQRGVILISALILVALAAIVAASLFFDTAMSARRTLASFSMEQALQLGQGAEALAAYGLSEDTNQTDTPTEDWAKPYGPVEIETGVGLEATLTDEQGKFNINTLIKIDGTHDENAMKVFKRLLELSGLEIRWAELIADWLDADTLPSPDGAEDSLYGSRTPPHLTGNQLLSNLSELQQLPEFTPAMYTKLRQHVTALPPQARAINVCTADGIVLDALYALSENNPRYVEHSQRTQEDMDKLRASDCFPRRADIESDVPKLKNTGMLAERSGFFGLHTTIRIGTTQFALYSLMYRSNKQARAVTRTFGID